jgi:hypothetical protein
MTRQFRCDSRLGLLAPLHRAWPLRPLAAHLGRDVCVHILHRIADAALLHGDIGAREQRLKMPAAIGSQGFLRQPGESSTKRSRSDLRPRRRDHDSAHWRTMADGQPRFFWGPLLGQSGRSAIL